MKTIQVSLVITNIFYWPGAYISGNRSGSTDHNIGIDRFYNTVEQSSLKNDFIKLYGESGKSFRLMVL